MCTALAVANINTMGVKIYHNPRCSKSRQTLALLEANGVEVEVIEYLNHPPSAIELKAILAKLGLSPLEVMRQGEDEFNTLVQGQDWHDDALIAMMVQYPRLIERPIVVAGDQAVIGRPPERVLSILH